MISRWDEMATAGVDVTGTVTIAIQGRSVGGAWTTLAYISADGEVPITGPHDRIRFVASRCSECETTTVGLIARRSGAAEEVLPPWAR